MRPLRSASFACVALALAGCSSAPVDASPTPPMPGVPASPRAATPSATSLPTPSMDVAQILLGTVQPATFASYPSPDGAWRIDLVIYPCTIVDPEAQQENSLEQLILVSAADGSRTVVDTQLLNCGGLGAAGLEGRFWTPDGAYFYYTGARDGVPDGCGYWETPQDRFSMIEGHAEYVGGGPISPDGTRIATWIDHRLTIWDVRGDRIASVPHPMEDALPGPIAWSPDGLSIAFLLSEAYCPLGTTHLVILDLDTLTPAVVLTSTDRSFAHLQWDERDRVLLVDEQSGTWSYNVDTGTLIPSSG